MGRREDNIEVFEDTMAFITGQETENFRAFQDEFGQGFIVKT